MDLNQSWTEYSYIAFDTETSGAYPLGAEIVEFGAVKWQKGEVIDELQILLKPRQPMDEEVIKIHGITNEMLVDAPVMAQQIHRIESFLSGCVLLAHHAPFDMGFLALALEENQLPLPQNPVICTSLLSRQVIPESKNHKLQTLVDFLSLQKNQAHRALDDAQSCLQVGLACMRRVGEQATLANVISKMGKTLFWQNYSLLRYQNPVYQKTIEAIQRQLDLDLIYDGGSLKGKTRRITPIGIVRNPDGDYIVGICHLDRGRKRFYTDKVKDIEVAMRQQNLF